MSKLTSGASLLTLSVLLLSGCSSLLETIEQSADYSDVQTIDYNLYRIEGTRGNINQALQLREYLYQRAQDYCMRNGQGAQLLDAVSGKRVDGQEGVRARLVFRCVGVMKAPEEEFVDNSPEAEEARRKNEQ